MGGSKKTIKKIGEILGWYLFLAFIYNMFYEDWGFINFIIPLILILAARFHENKVVIFLTKIIVFITICYLLFSLYYF